MTVTGIARVSSKIWVMPSFVPRIPLISAMSHNLISMSTPADRFRRWSSWTVFDVASTMSMSRLCVSIWKCSRLSLYLCGERITV